MSGQGTVKIGENEWDVSIATTFYEIVHGLSGLESMDPGTGMLFDMGSNTDIDINMDEMLFSLDIVFIECEETDEGNVCSVSSVARNVEPGAKGITGTGRYFMEVNAGECDDVDVGDNVDITITLENELLGNLINILLATPILIGGAVLTLKATKNRQ